MKFGKQKNFNNNKKIEHYILGSKIEIRDSSHRSASSNKLNSRDESIEIY